MSLAKPRPAKKPAFSRRTFHLPGTVSQDELFALVRQLNVDPRFPSSFRNCRFRRTSTNSPISTATSRTERCGWPPSGESRAPTPRRTLRRYPLHAPRCPRTPCPHGQRPRRKASSSSVGHPRWPAAQFCSSSATRRRAATPQSPSATPAPRISLGHTRTADILVMAAGRPRTLPRGTCIKPGAVVIDVGTNRIDDATPQGGRRLVGDADFHAIKEVASCITPSPVASAP